MIDARLLLHDQEEISAGEAVAGMSLHGLGFSQRPVSLPPQFFANTPLARLCREGVRAEMCNRCKLGRTRDEVHAYGGDLLWSERALAVWAQEGRDERFTHLDPTSFSRTGDDVPDRDEHAMAITQGDSKDHRPDVQQAVFALMGAQDGGVPWRRNSWDGHASDTQMFQEGAQALRATFRESPNPRYLVADAQLYTEDHAPNLAPLGLLTRIPGTLQRVTQVISQARPWDTWPYLHARTREQCIEWCHDSLAQRWLVVVSQAALARAEARVNQACQRQAAAIKPPRLHLQAKRFATPTQAPEAWSGWARPWRDPQGESSALLDHQRHGHKGRPTAATPLHALEGQRPAQVRLEAKRREDATQQTAGLVLGTHIETEQLSDAEVIAGDNAPSQAEGGCRWLQDPWCFVASLLVKKPRRMQGLWMVMTLALLVYAVAQRRRRRA